MRAVIRASSNMMILAFSARPQAGRAFGTRLTFAVAAVAILISVPLPQTQQSRAGESKEGEGNCVIPSPPGNRYAAALAGTRNRKRGLGEV